VKVAGGLNYVTGPMGSGKSLYGVRRIVDYVSSGRYVITNVELYPDWHHRLAKHVAPLKSARARQKLAGRLQRLYVYEDDLLQAMRYRVPGRGEARALFVWDETHNDLSNRNWRERQKAHTTSRGTDATLEWATQLRKLGFVGFLLSQHHENTDVALRRVCNWLVRLQNQKENVRVLGLPVTPWPLFLAFWYATNIPQGSTQKAAKVERYFLSWHRNLYDTHGLYHGLAQLDADSDAIHLPEPGAVVPSLPAGDEGPTASGGRGNIRGLLTFPRKVEAAPVPPVTASETLDASESRRALPTA